MRVARTYFAVLLACLLAFAQQASMTHALSHFTDEQNQQKHLPGAKACEKCAAFAELNGAISGKTPVFYLPHLSQSQTGKIFTESTLVTSLSYQSRAPPSLL